MIRIEENCLHCGAELIGRTDKKYCNLKCKSAHQYKTSKLRPERFYDKVDFQLRWNRKLLKEHFEKGKRVIESCEVLNRGFDRRYCTHHWKHRDGNTYIFVFDYGYLKQTNGDAEEYCLVSHKDFGK